jgi:hypothetical protein
MKLLNWLREYLIIFCIGFLIPISAVAQQSEYTIKAVFLEHFTRFIEWPDSSGITDTSTPFIVAVIGENPFDSILEQTYAKQKIKNKNVEIRYISTPDEIADCHILFISSTNKDILPEILARTSNKSILTVSDTESFAQKKVLINFYLSGDKIKFEINEKAVHESGLVMSYRLLNLARIVNPVRRRK